MARKNLLVNYVLTKKAIDQFSPNAVAKLCPLVPSPDNVVESLKRYVGSMKLRNSPDSIWHTAFIIYYLKNVLTDYEKEWRDACYRACAWITEQVDDAEVEKELYSACEQYLLLQGVDLINSRGGIVTESDETVDVVVLQVSEETRKAVHKSLRDDVSEEVARTLCNSQEPNGSFTLHKSISDHLKIRSIYNAVESLKRYVGSSFLRNSGSPLWCTALTITYLRIVLADYKQEWKPTCYRAAAWISEQCKYQYPEDEKELYSACDQFLIKQGIEVLNEKNRQQPRLTKRRSVVKGDAYLNSELIVVGAAITANRKFKRSCAESEKVDKAQARERIIYRSDDAAVAEKELLDCTDKYVDNVTKRMDKDHKKTSPITNIQESALPDTKSGEDKRYVTQKYNFTPEDLLKLIAKKSSN
ncbi:hypothetical protein C2G38_2043082 [Gigaspora rosea]|uniref:Uncharacterized protein n=1 Tax=Gigaspora rosea TaxID=44941 RepID=A0A397UL07_9GLOM|nr:hypothetical protein C2G38_2043082 [Gigaspora rosea]